MVQTTSIHDLDQQSQANSDHNQDVADTVVEQQSNGNREQQNLQELPVEVVAEFEPEEINISLKQSLESIRKSKLGSTTIDPETDEQHLEEEEELVHE